MKLKDSVNEVVQSGVTPLQLTCDTVKFFDEEKKLLRTFLEVESLDVGHLTYKEYRFVARRTKVGDALVQRHVEKLFRAYPELIKKRGISCLTIPVYARILMGGKLAGLLFDALNYFEEVEPSRICIELSADLLYEDIEEAKKRIDELRQMGFKVAVCEVGDEFCPVFRLAELKFDYAFVDDFVCESLEREDAERIAGSIVKFLQYVGVKAIIPDISGKKQAEKAKLLGFSGYINARPAPSPMEVAAYET